MGRTGNSIPSEIVPGRAGAVADAWRRHERERLNKASERSGRLLAEADAWLSRYPEFVTTDGTPCFMAVKALLHLRSEYGEGKVTRAMVRRAWLAHLSSREDMDWYAAEFLPHLKKTEGTK